MELGADHPREKILGCRRPAGGAGCGLAGFVGDDLYLVVLQDDWQRRTFTKLLCFFFRFGCLCVKLKIAICAIRTLYPPQ